MSQQLIRQTSFLLSFFMLLSGLIVPITASGQDAEESVEFMIGAYICPYNPGPVSVYAGTVPPDCIPVSGMHMHAVVDGAVGISEAACTTSEGGNCYVTVPIGSMLTITENTGGRADLVPVVNPLATFATAMDAIFVHVVEPVIVSDPVVLPPEPVEGDESGDVTDPVEGDEAGDVTDPVEGDEVVDVTDPVEGDEAGDVTDPVEGDEAGDVTDPVEGDEAGDVTDPVEGDESGDVTDPVEDGDAGDVTDPVEGDEAGDVTDPVEGDEADDVTDPVEGDEAGDVTDPVEGDEAGDVTDPVEGDEAIDVTDPANGGEIVVATPGDVGDGSQIDEGESTGQPAVGYVLGAGETGLICYAQPDVTSEQLHTFSEGDQIKILFESTDGFVNVSCGDGVGYVDSTMISEEVPAEIPSQPGAISPSGTPEAVVIGTPEVGQKSTNSTLISPLSELKPKISVEMVVGAPGARLACYSEPGDAVPIKWFVNGNQFYSNGPVTNGWLPIDCGGVNGYVESRYTTAEPQAPKPATTVEMLTGTDGIACRTAPHPQATVIMMLPGGTQFPATGPAANGWLPIQCKGRGGYIPISATTVVAQAPRATISIEKLTGTARVACLTAPHPRASVITNLPAGTLFPATGHVINGWLPVQCHGRHGYIPASGTTAFVRAPKPLKSVEMLVGVGANGLACRTAPHTGASVIATLRSGTQFYSTGSATNGWLPVHCGGRDGFIPAANTTAFVRPPKAAKSVEMLLGVGNSGLACRTAPHPAASVITTLSSASKFYITGSATGGWLPIQCGNRDGFIPAALTTAAVRPPKALKSVEQLIGVGNGVLACRTAPHPAATIVANLRGGTQFYSTGSATDGWLPIRCGGRDGFIPATLTTTVPRPPKAGTSVEMLLTSENQACRTAPHPAATIVMNLRGGTQFVATGPVANGWLPVQCGGRDGFVQSAFTTMTHRAPGAITSVQMAIDVGSGGLACHTAPHPKASSIGSISNNQIINVTGPASNGWLPIECDGRQGYIPWALTTLVSRPLQAATGGTTIFNTARVGTICRTAPSTMATAIVTLYEGTYVRTTGAAVHNWLPVQCGNQNGYIHMSSTTTRVPHQGPGIASRAAMVQGTGNSGLVCRTQAAGGSYIATLSERTPVEVLSWSNGWAHINCGTTTGYVAMKFLTFNASDPWTTNEVISIDVNLSSQYLVVYQGERIIGQTYISSGRVPTFETPTGTFYIGYKIPVSAMAGCSEGECWYVPDVPNQMYFTNRGHAFHGAYWHNDFGNPRSHGCINLPIGIDSWLYSITPVGTRVTIHY